jgi:hypothetical protein
MNRFIGACLVLGALASPAHAQTRVLPPPPPKNPVQRPSPQPQRSDRSPALNDVRAAFGAIRAAGTPMGFGSGPFGPDAGVFDYKLGLVGRKSTSHWEGMGRLEGSPHLVMSANEDGELLLVRMGSRPAGSGRWGTNRSGKGAPPSSDAIVPFASGQTTFKLGTPGYSHLGGLSVVGDYVAVGLEKEGDSSTDAFIHLVDFSSPTSPRAVWSFRHPHSSGGTVALTKRPDGFFLLAVGGWGSRTVDFYRSTSSSLEATTWTHLRQWSRKECVNAVPKDSTCFAEYQNLTFVAQTDGRLFFIGTNRNGSDEDWLDLHEVTGIPTANETSAPALRITKVAKKHMVCNDGCNFKAAGGVFVNGAAQEIYVYATAWRRTTTSGSYLSSSNGLWTRFNEL